MAREIDLEELNDDDLLYMSQRSWLVEEALLVHGVDVKPQINKLLGVEGPPSDAVDVSEESTPDPKDYESMKKDDLVAEITARNADFEDEADHIAVSGTKDELIARLREDDAAADAAQ